MKSYPTYRNKLKNIAFLAVIIFLWINNYSLLAQTQVGGIISSSVTWSIDNSPYIVTSSLKISTGGSLTIEPGVDVHLNGSNIQVEGELIAMGTKDANITFSAISGGSWGNIYFTSTAKNGFINNGEYVSGSILSYCILNGGGSNNAGTIFIEESAPYITNCQILNSASYGIKLIRTENLIINGTKIYNSTSDGIYIEKLQRYRLTITDTDISNNNGKGINYVHGIHPGKTIINTTKITHNSGGIHLYSSGGSGSGSIEIDHCEISYNTSVSGAGAYIYRGYDLIFTNNIVTYNSGTNGAGLYFGAGWNPYEYVIENNVFVGNEAANGAAIYMDLVNMSYNNIVSIQKNHFIENNSTGSILYLGDSYSTYVTATCNNNTFDDNTSYGLISFYQYKNSFSQNNIFDGQSTYLLKNGNVAGDPDINATENYFHEIQDLEEKIYDWTDNDGLSSVSTDPVLHSPDTAAPIRSPNPYKVNTDEGVTVYWHENVESDLAKYTVFNLSAGNYQYVETVTDSFFATNSLTIADTIVVKSYDDLADGENDLFEGHESWYSTPAIYPFDMELNFNENVCENSEISIKVTPNYEFSGSNLFILQLSNINGSFKSAVNLDSISNPEDLLTSTLPDTLQSFTNYQLRVLSSELNVFTRLIDVVPIPNPSSLFESDSINCSGEPLSINYIGDASTEASFSWDFDDATNNSGSGQGPFEVFWEIEGYKNISLQVDENGCSSKSFASVKVKKTPSSDFTVQSIICEGESAIVTYTGNTMDSANYIWGFDGGTILNGTGSGPYEMIWDSFGSKALRLIVTENGCSSEVNEKTVEYVKYPTMTFEAEGSACYNEDYYINFTGSDYTELSWIFEDANIISGSGSGPFLLNWDTSGEKLIYLSATNKGCSSDSTLYVDIPEAPIIPEICMVTVDAERNKNMLIWSYDLASLSLFGIYRETNVSGEYELVEYVEGGNYNVYVDEQSIPEQKSYRYKISGMDSCGTETELSSFHKTIHLTINRGIGNSWNLIWNGYEGFDFGTYRIYKSVNGDEFELLTEIASNLTSYTDTDVSSENIAYQIEVFSPNDCFSISGGRTSQVSSSRSNIARSHQVLGIEDFKDGLNVFPNPSNEFINVKLQNGQLQEYELLSAIGRIVKSGKLNNSGRIDLKDVSKGVYLLKVFSTKGIISEKIVKE